MVSKERLEEIASGVAYGFGLKERTEIAKELLAWRKAAVEHAGKVQVNEHSVSDVEWDGDWLDGCPVGEYIVIRKPDLAGGGDSSLPSTDNT